MTVRIQSIVLVLAVSVLPACNVQPGGLVVFMDENDVAEIVTTSTAGFQAPDGILWHANRLSLADEGGTAVVARMENQPFKLLADRNSGIQSPEDLAVAADGTIFFTDDDAGGVWQITTAGDVSQLAGKSDGLTSTEGLVITPQGNLLVGDGAAHSIFEVTPQGDVSLFLGPEAGISKPESLVFDEHGNLYIADNEQNVVFRVDRDGRVEKLITARNGLSRPESICYHNGVLYITDPEAGKLFGYTSNSLQTVAVFAGRLKNVQGIAATPDGSLLLTVQDLKRKTGLVIKITRGAALPSTDQVATVRAKKNRD